MHYFHACIGSYRIQELEIKVCDADDAINEQKVQHKRQTEELQSKYVICM